MLKSKMINIVGITVTSVVFTLAMSLFVMFCMDKYFGMEVPLFSAFGNDEETEIETGLQYDGYDGVVEIPDGFDWADLDGFDVDIPEEYEDHMWPTVANGFIGEPDDLPFGETVFSVRTTRDGLLYLKNANYGDYNGQGWNAAKEYSEFLYGKYSAAYLTGAVMRENNFLTDTLVVRTLIDRYATPYYLSVVGENGHVQSSDVYSNGNAGEEYVLSYYSDVDWHNLKPVKDPEAVEFELDYRVFVYENYTYLDKTTENKLQKIIEVEGLDQYETTFEIIDAVAKYIKDNMTLNRTYSRDMDKEANVLIAFLEKYKEGDIQHFASAATILYRALGIPARYTTGHAVLCAEGEDTDILVENGHAWTEVYLDGIGWICIDVVNHVLTNPGDTGEDGDGIGIRDDVDLEKVVATLLATEGNTLYLKSESKGDYTGQGWLEAKEYTSLIGNIYSASYLPGYICDENGYRTNSVIITPAEGTSLPSYLVPYYVSSVSNSASGQIQTSDVYSKGDIRKTYSMNYYRVGDWEYLQGLPAEYVQYEKAYREFVYNNYLNIDSTTKAFMDAIIKVQGFDKIESDQRMKLISAVAQYIKDSAEYSMKYDRALDESANVVIAFLSEYKQGICQHYAASATMMYRALGIPARYTVGYLAETKTNKTVEVKAKDAHAWVEVYIDGFGWKQVEVTAGFESDPMFEVTLTPEYGEFEWNDELHYPPAVLGFEEFSKLGYTLECQMTPHENPGDHLTKVKEEGLKILDSEGNDVTYMFNITTEYGSMLITRPTIELVPVEAEFVYDRNPKSPTEVTGFEKYADSYKLEVKCTEATYPGEYATQVIEYKITDADGANISEYFNVLTPETGRMVIVDDSPEVGLPEDFDDTVINYYVTSNVSGTLYLKSQSKGDYYNNAWLAAPDYEGRILNNYSVSYIPGTLLQENGASANTVTIVPVSETGKAIYIVPYYMAIGEGNGSIQKSDVYMDGDSSVEYVLSFYSGEAKSYNSAIIDPSAEEAYRSFVYQNYLNVDSVTKAYMRSVINGDTSLNMADGMNNVNSKIYAVSEYIRNAAVYSMKYDREMDKSENVAIAFLRDYKEGICQHYATAATLMLRTMGIPARYCEGFAVSVKANEETPVRIGHAWVEVYIDGFGWQYVEVTGSNQITVSPKEIEHAYDGEEKSPEKIEGFEKYEALGYSYECEYTKAKNVGRYETEITNITIFDKKGVNITSQFVIDKEPGLMRIEGGEISIDWNPNQNLSHDANPGDVRGDNYLIEERLKIDGTYHSSAPMINGFASDVMPQGVYTYEFENYDGYTLKVVVTSANSVGHYAVRVISYSITNADGHRIETCSFDYDQNLKTYVLYRDAEEVVKTETVGIDEIYDGTVFDVDCTEYNKGSMYVYYADFRFVYKKSKDTGSYLHTHEYTGKERSFGSGQIESILVWFDGAYEDIRANDSMAWEYLVEVGLVTDDTPNWTLAGDKSVTDVKDGEREISIIATFTDAQGHETNLVKWTAGGLNEGGEFDSGIKLRLQILPKQLTITLKDYDIDKRGKTEEELNQYIESKGLALDGSNNIIFSNDYDDETVGEYITVEGYVTYTQAEGVTRYHYVSGSTVNIQTAEVINRDSANGKYDTQFNGDVRILCKQTNADGSEEIFDVTSNYSISYGKGSIDIYG